MPIPVAAIANAAKTGLDLIKQNEGSSSESSIANVKQYETVPTEIKRTEGDLGYDENELQKPEAQNTDYTEQFENSQIANIENPNRPEAEANAKIPLTKDAFESLFNVANGVASESGSASGETTTANPIANEGGNAQYVEDSQGTDSTFRSSPLGTESAVPIANTQEVGGLNVPAEANAQPTTEEKSLLDEAKEAAADGDIDDKELPIADSEQAAEDIEDLVEDKTKSDEEKEEILEKAADDDKIEEGEIAEEAGETQSEETNEETNPIDKGKELLDKILPYLKHDSSSSASSSISGGSTPDVEGVNFKSSTLSDDVAQLLSGSASTSANIEGQGSISSIANPNYKQPVESAVSQKGASSSKAAINANTNNSTATSSSSGPIAKAFNDIINGKGAEYTSTSGESRFGSNLGSGNVKSVNVKPSDGLKVNNTANANANANANPYDTIRAEIIESSKDWKERDGLKFKDKGGLLILTDGNDVKIKMGTRRIKDLDEIPVDKLDYIEEVI